MKIIYYFIVTSPVWIPTPPILTLPYLVSSTNHTHLNLFHHNYSFTLQSFFFCIIQSWPKKLPTTSPLTQHSFGIRCRSAGEIIRKEREKEKLRERIYLSQSRNLLIGRSLKNRDLKMQLWKQQLKRPLSKSEERKRLEQSQPMV